MEKLVKEMMKSARRWATTDNGRLDFTNVYANNIWFGVCKVLLSYKHYKRYHDYVSKEDTEKRLQMLEYDVKMLNDKVITNMYRDLEKMLQGV